MGRPNETDSSLVYSAEVSDTLVAVSATEAFICSINMVNQSGADAYLQVFDAATVGAVTLGTTTPDFVLGLSDTLERDATFPKPIHMVNGIVVASTTTRGGDTAGAQDVTITYIA
jgi:hypothetical protein